MKINRYMALFALAFSVNALAEQTETLENKGAEPPIVQLSAKVTREVEKDLMVVRLFSEKEGKSLPELKKNISAELNKVLESVKKMPSIEYEASGVSSYVNYNNKGKVSGWNAFGEVVLKSKDFESMAKILENLGENVAIRSVDFSVSPEKLASLEDEMTQEAIKQFQHRAEVTVKSLNAKGYSVRHVNLDEPTAGINYEYRRAAVASYSLKSSAEQEMPLQAGKETLSATATGSILIKP